MIEPVYTYVRGQGWVPRVNAYNWDLVDLRFDTAKPGRYYVQVWLVGIDGYHYEDWTDNWGVGHTSADEAFAKLEKWCTRDSVGSVKRLVSQGMKMRVVQRD